jgi:hypothetical protein
MARLRPMMTAKLDSQAKPAALDTDRVGGKLQ